MTGQLTDMTPALCNCPDSTVRGFGADLNTRSASLHALAALEPRPRDGDLARVGDADANLAARLRDERPPRRLERVGHGDEERVVLEANRDRPQPFAHVGPHAARREGVDRRRLQVEVRHVVLDRDRPGDVLLEDEAELDEDVAEPPAGAALNVERAIELLGPEQPLLNEQGPKVRASLVLEERVVETEFRHAAGVTGMSVVLSASSGESPSLEGVNRGLLLGRSAAGTAPPTIGQ